MGSHEWSNNVPLSSNPVFFHPFESDVVGFVLRYVMGYSVVFVDVVKVEAGSLGKRYSMIADQCLVMPFVIPSWPTSLPPLIIAISEKDRGNEYFKEKKFNDAVECYSRSIISSPNAVAYANRAAAYLKVDEYLQAESDCTEALKLDQHYLKAYARRAIARKELGKLEEAKKDAELALKLAPQQLEILKQYDEINSMLEKVKLPREMAMKMKPCHNHSMAEAGKMSTPQTGATPGVEKERNGQPLSPVKETASVETQPMDSTLQTFVGGTSKMTSPSKETSGETPLGETTKGVATDKVTFEDGEREKELGHEELTETPQQTAEAMISSVKIPMEGKKQRENELAEIPNQIAKASSFTSEETPIEGEKEKEKESTDAPVAKNSIAYMETRIKGEKELSGVDNQQAEREPTTGINIQMSTPLETLLLRTGSIPFDFKDYKEKIDSLLESLKGKPLEFTEFDTLRKLITEFISHPQMSSMPLLVKKLQICAKEIEILEELLQTNASYARTLDETIKTKDLHFQQIEEAAAKAKSVSTQGDEEDAKVKNLQTEVHNLEVQMAKLNADLVVKKDLLIQTSQRRDALRIEADKLLSKHQTLVSFMTNVKESSLDAFLQKGLMEVELHAQLLKISKYQIVYRSL